MENPNKVTALVQIFGLRIYDVTQVTLPWRKSLSFDRFCSFLRELSPQLKHREFKVLWKDTSGNLLTMLNDEDYRLAVESMDGTVLPVFIKIIEDLKLSDNGQEVHHPRVLCSFCIEYVNGIRYRCLECRNVDLCSRCDAQDLHPHHTMARIYQPKVKECVSKGIQVGPPEAANSLLCYEGTEKPTHNDTKNFKPAPESYDPVGTKQGNPPFETARSRYLDGGVTESAVDDIQKQVEEKATAGEAEKEAKSKEEERFKDEFLSDREIKPDKEHDDPTQVKGAFGGVKLRRNGQEIPYKLSLKEREDRTDPATRQKIHELSLDVLKGIGYLDKDGSLRKLLEDLCNKSGKVSDIILSRNDSL